MTHIIHNKGDLQMYFCVIFLETRHHAQVHVTSGALIDCSLSLASVCYDDSQVAKHLLQLHLLFQSGGGAILALSSFLNQIPHHKEPEISVGIFSPTLR